MGYDNLERIGILADIGSPCFVDRATNPNLVFPETTHSTSVHIESPQGGFRGEIFGIVPKEYLGQTVRLVQGYYKLTEEKELFMQELYVEDKRVLNKAVVRSR